MPRMVRLRREKLQEILPCQVSRGETLFVKSNTTDDSSPHYDHVCFLSSIVTQENDVELSQVLFSPMK